MGGAAGLLMGIKTKWTQQVTLEEDHCVLTVENKQGKGFDPMVKTLTSQGHIVVLG